MSFHGSVFEIVVHMWLPMSFKWMPSQLGGVSCIYSLTTGHHRRHWPAWSMTSKVSQELVIVARNTY